jgi:Family of unknown function (DUF5677)
MRDKKFEAVLLSLEKKIHGSIKRIKGASRKQLAVSGLASKCLSHCEMALSLVDANALAEAIIILRSAYEAIIRGIYLDENPDKLPAYEAFSAIVMLRNQLEMLKLLDEFGEPYKDKELQEKLIKQQQERIVAQGFHSLYKLSEADLDSWEAVKKITNKSNLPNFEEIRTSIKKTPLVKALLTTGFQVYNLGSQMAHSSFEMMSVMVYFDMKHPLYNEHTVYRQALLLMLCTCQCFASCGVISDEDFELLKKDYEQAGKDLVIAGSLQQ